MHPQKRNVVLALGLISVLAVVVIGFLTLPLSIISAQEGNAQATIDAAVQLAFTQTAEAAVTENFPLTVEAALYAAQTATAQSQAQEVIPTITPSPTLPATEIPVTTDASGLFTLLNTLNIGSPVNAVRFNADLNQLAVGTSDGTITIWSFPTSETPFYNLAQGSAVNGVLFHPSDPTIVGGGQNGDVVMWQTFDGEEFERSNTQNDVSQGAVPLGFSADGSQLASFDFNGNLTLWEYPRHDAIQESGGYAFALPYFPTRTLAYSPADDPTKIVIANLDSGEVQREFPLDADYVEPVRFSRDGRRLIAVADEKNVLLDVFSGEVLITWDYVGYGLSVFSPDEALIAEGGLDGQVVIWNVGNPVPYTTLIGHAAAVTEVAYSADGRFLVSGSEDGTVNIWERDLSAVIAAALPEVEPTAPAIAPTEMPMEPTTISASSGPTPLPDGFPPVTEAQVQTAEQVFERGRMMWVQPVNQIWVMVINEEGRGQWLVYPDNFDEAVDSVIDESLQAPEGLIQPERGFGKLWRENPEVRDALGWAITPEFGYQSLYRYIPGGEMANGEYVPGPGYHVLFSLDGEAFRFNEVDETWQLGEQNR